MVSGYRLYPCSSKLDAKSDPSLQAKKEERKEQIRVRKNENKKERVRELHSSDNAPSRDFRINKKIEKFF